MSDVAESVGVSQGLAYRYFASKEALFSELIDQTTQSGLALLPEVRKMSGTPGERLHFLISKSFERMREQIDFYRLFAQVFDDETILHYKKPLNSQETKKKNCPRIRSISQLKKQ